ncbi:SDR family oxidoreductase [Mycobacterium sp. Y57]|uniref:SDR family NAD(P)-dependent oxidoreductase n=1 Tax=Mycolicibacterium xanthum TaxID=2796469 RepID=UPI001C8635ED|nr:SDR family oxidoreductase [Mycolicibacterium xanthum]MBX7435437.1 SDR family oxidoreductase [Mycolicibacterium xanthum]
MGKLDEKVAVITGCASGLGKQHALRFATEGAKLAICDIQEAKLAETKRLCEERGAEVVALGCDVGQYEELVTFVEATADRFGTIDILLNNAHKITELRPFLDSSAEDLSIELHTSLYASWHMMKLCFPYMRDKPGAGASIINTASKGGVEGTRFHAAYAAAKEGIRGLSRVVAREWGEFNIRVNTVSPGGWTDNVTSQLHERSPEVQEWARAAFKDNPFGRIGDPYEDVSPIVVFLASDESHWMTGQNVHADGGVWIGA